MESISLLLHFKNHPSRVAPKEVNEKDILNYLGLVILKKLAEHHDTCGKIGEKIVKTVEEPYENGRIRWRASPAKDFQECFTISNIREILCFGGKHVKPQMIGIQILTSLGLEDNAKESIGSTGGILKELVEIFFNQRRPEAHDTERDVAEEALAMLAFESKQNCHWILKLNVVEKLLKGVATAATTVLRAIMAEQNKLQELMLGSKNKKIHNRVSDMVDESEQSHIYVFRELGMKQELENVMETTSELESFNTFSGSIGLNRYAKTMQSLIDEVLKLLSNGCVGF
ncbi:hypothetical protein Sjap_004844 [Stephania japonica]|uniref:Uncharacterized protein n=1 Tax=Stephania japonica TaxID=461633 RepID=A0AAP0PL98_9MAGN